jgi:hypothetical protein
MRPGKIIRLWKSMAVLTTFIVFLVVLTTPSKTEGGEEANPSGVSLLRTGAKDPSSFLKNFAFIPGSAVLIERQYILALYQNSEKELFALAVFTADCNLEGCAIEDLVIYSIFDAQGQDIRLANNLQTESWKVRPEAFPRLT